MQTHKQPRYKTLRMFNAYRSSYYANILTKNVCKLHKINVFMYVGMHLEHETIKLSVWSISIFKLQNAA